MPLTQNAEHKRRSRARKPSAWHDRERESSRQRMALGRARNKAQKRASLLRSLLDEAAKQTFQARADEERQRLICDWFRRKKLKLTPKEINDDEIINNSMPKPDLCKIEIQVAEFEISMMTTGVGDDSDDGENFASEQEKVKAINRKRMAIHRAMKKSQKRASQLRSRLDKWDKLVLEARAEKEKQRLICDWFRRKGWRMDLESINDDVVKDLMPKFDLQKIETQVAEFEISIMGVGGDNDEEKNLASGLDKSKGKRLPKALYKIDSSEQHLNNQIGPILEKEMTTSEKQTVLETNRVPETTGTPSTLPEELCKIDSSEQHLNGHIGRPLGKETTTSEKRKILETTSVPETGMPSMAAGESGKDAFETAEIIPITCAEKKRRSRGDDAERKRRSRAKQSSAWHDQERESSRQRMALGRARKMAQKRASQLRSLLDEADKQVFEGRVHKEKQRLICDWFGHKGLIMDPESINDNVVNNFVPKLDLQKIELQVAEFEIALMGVGGDNAQEKKLASGTDKEKKMATSEKRTVPETTSARGTTGTPLTAAGDFGKDAAAASLLLLGLRGAKGDETAAIGIASVREAPPTAVRDSDEGASRLDPVGATGINDDGTAARHAATSSLDAGTAPVAFPPWEGWRSAIDQGSGRVNYYRHLPERRAPSAFGDDVLTRGGAGTGRGIGVGEVNNASIPDTVMSSHA